MKKILGLLVLILTLSSCSILDNIYEWQKSESRDMSRISDMKVIEAWLYQIFSDIWEFPTTLDEIKTYLPYWIPVDVKDWETIDWCIFWYVYEVFEKDTIPNNWYRLSTCFESSAKQKLYKTDNWIYDNKYELWNFY